MMHSTLQVLNLSSFSNTPFTGVSNSDLHGGFQLCFCDGEAASFLEGMTELIISTLKLFETLLYWGSREMTLARKYFPPGRYNSVKLKWLKHWAQWNYLEDSFLELFKVSRFFVVSPYLERAPPTL